MNEVWTEVRFWSMVMEDAKQTVVCSPELESRVKGYIDARGLGGLITVVVNPAVGDDRLFVLPTNMPPLTRGAIKFRAAEETGQ